MPIIDSMLLGEEYPIFISIREFVALSQYYKLTPEEETELLCPEEVPIFYLMTEVKTQDEMLENVEKLLKKLDELNCRLDGIGSAMGSLNNLNTIQGFLNEIRMSIEEHGARVAHIGE
jgi:hypothetical protein